MVLMSTLGNPNLNGQFNQRRHHRRSPRLGHQQPSIKRANDMTKDEHLFDVLSQRYVDEISTPPTMWRGSDIAELMLLIGFRQCIAKLIRVKSMQGDFDGE